MGFCSGLQHRSSLFQIRRYSVKENTNMYLPATGDTMVIHPEFERAGQKAGLQVWRAWICFPVASRATSTVEMLTWSSTPRGTAEETSSTTSTSGKAAQQFLASTSST